MDATSYHDIKSSLCQLYAKPSNGECPIQIDTSTPSCGNSRFGRWTCTVVDRDKASEGLLATGDERMEHLIQFRDTPLESHEPANGWRDSPRGNCTGRPSPSVTSVHCKPHKGSNQAGDKVWLRFK